MKNFLLPLSCIATFATPVAANVSCSGGGSELNSSGKLTIARWGNDVELTSQQAAINEFKKLYPNIKIEMLTLDYGKRIEQISKWAASGNLPDIIETDGSDYSSYAVSEIIKKLDASKLSSKTLSGIAPQALGTMVGNVSNEKWTYGIVPQSQTASSFMGTSSLWGVPKEFNTLGIYVNKGAYDWTKASTAGGINVSAHTGNQAAGYIAYKTAWNQLSDKTNSNLFDILKDIYKTSSNQIETVAKKGYHKGPLSFTNDPNRFTQLFTQADYYKYKSYTLSDIISNHQPLKTSIQSWYPKIKSQYQNINSDGGALTSQGHGYGWNGEAFDKKAVGAVIEGAWFTPSNDIYQDPESWDIWESPNPGLFPQGWAITNNSNDDDWAYKFMDFMASEKGSKLETSLTGANPVNKNAIASKYNDALKVMGDSSATVQDKAKAKKIIAHSKTFVTVTSKTASFNAQANARPLLFTSEYPLFQKAWNDNFANHVRINANPISQSVFNSIIDSVVDDWVHSLKEL